MIKFCAKYGGGIDQKHACELIDYLSVRMAPDRRVPGYQFDHVNKIPISVTFAIPKLAVAVIKANAKEKHAVMDNIGRVIDKKDVQRMSRDLRDKAIEAEGYIRRVHQAMHEAGREAVVDMGDFEVDMVLALFDKHPEELTCADVATACTKRTFGASDTSGTSATSRAPSSTPQPSTSSHMIQFDNNGCAINVGLQTVHASGFHVGDMVLRSDQFARRWTAHLRGTLFELTFIGSDGSVSLTQLGISGERTPHVIQLDSKRDT